MTTLTSNPLAALAAHTDAPPQRIDNLPMDQYRDIPAASQSVIKQARHSMKHVRHSLTEAWEETDAMRLGTALHIAVLEPETFSDRVASYAGRRQGKAWDAFCEASEGKVLLTANQWQACEAMAEAIIKETAGMVLPERPEDTEVTLTWSDPSGLPLKARLDALCGTLIPDIKTTSSIDQGLFQNHAYRLGYDIQEAMYIDACEAVTGETGFEMMFICVESSPPYDVALVQYTDADRAAARKELRALTKRVRRALRTDVWPGRHADVLTISRPDWA